MNTFNVGDKVMVIGNSYDHCFELGQICVVAGFALYDDDIEVEGRQPWGESGDNIQQIMHNTDIELVK